MRESADFKLNFQWVYSIQWVEVSLRNFCCGKGKDECKEVFRKFSIVKTYFCTNLVEIRKTVTRGFSHQVPMIIHQVERCQSR